MQSGSTILITGAAGFLGSAVTERFLAAGYRVIAMTLEMPAPGAPEKPGLKWVKADLSDSASVKNALAAHTKDIRALVHCAGGFRWALAEQVTDADIDFLIGSNLKSAFYLVRELLPSMKSANFGRIVFVSAKQTQGPAAGMSAYAASKAGLNMLTLALAEETKKNDITVNAVMPSIIDTPANRKDMPGADFSAWVSPKELAEIIFSLTQPGSRAITGALIPVSGKV